MRDEKKVRPVAAFRLPPSAFILKLRRALRGELTWRAALLEAGRRSRVALERRRERARLQRGEDFSGGGGRARLRTEFAQMSAAQLLAHFRTRPQPSFLPGFDLPAPELARLQHRYFPTETVRLIEDARRIAAEHAWPLLGFGVRHFGADIDWRRDLLSGVRWPLDYHGDVNLFRGDGSDARVVWEVNRLGHLITLGRAYALTDDESFAVEFFAQVEGWRAQNPVGRGVNWSCAMEAALRAINLLAAFRLFRRSPQLTGERLAMLLGIFDEHGTHIRRHLEFSYIVTSNHYLSDVAGLLWLGLCLPELEAARGWREWALRALLTEMDKQVLGDGADAEASTGYHRLVLELFLFSFVLCRANEIEIEARYWQKLRAMFDYVRAYLRPDGRAPLIGDTDSGQVLPLTRRAADDHAYVLAIGAALFDEPRWKVSINGADAGAGAECEAPEEVLWVLGGAGLDRYWQLPYAAPSDVASRDFTEAGTYIMRAGDLYLLFNASGAGLGGRGSHGHNDALSVEVSACGASFIADPGTYVYVGDLRARHQFRSTAYHSTVEVDGAEQNAIDERAPFDIGDEAQPRVLRWESDTARDIVVAEHDGYRRLRAGAVGHRRAVTFDKDGRFWLIEDTLRGAGAHEFRFRFHFAPGTRARSVSDGIVEVCDKMARACLLVIPLEVASPATLEQLWSSRGYGERSETRAACWTVRAHPPLVVRWALVPVCAGEDAAARWAFVSSTVKR